MIITHLEASNILKYRRLDLSLPERGLIAISGQNESGKSSIGEAVCFALFGRTFSVAPDELHKVVRWGENHCSVNLRFKVDDQEYALSRFLDRDGHHSAKLSPAGQDEPLARGVRQVAERLTELLGFEYEQFVESFYLAQREITTPQPHSQAVKIMAGVAPLEQVVSEIEDEIGERKDLLEEVQAECDQVHQELEALGIREGYLQQLEQERMQTRDQIDQVNGLVEAMGEGMQRYADNTRAAYKAAASASRAGLLRFLSLLLALAAGAGWWLRGAGAQLPATAQVRDLLDRHVPQWQQVPAEWLLWGAGGFGVLFLLFWLRGAGRRSLARRLREEAAGLGETLRQAREIELDVQEEAAPDTAESDSGTPPEGGMPEAGEAEAEPPAPERPDAAVLDGLLERIEAGQATVRQVREYVEPEQTWLAYVAELLERQVWDLDSAISDEEERLREQANLLQVREGMRDKREDILARIDLRNKALELLHGAIGHLSNNFNRDIKELVARMLPRFTDGRYEHLQIDADLNVRVFSAEKRDFMDLEEVSSGTQRQIMLALRLALSQKLLSRKIRGRQFAFLDEPFAFFDEERTRNALIALTELGDDISQVWIVAQSFPRDAVAFDAHIECERGRDALSLQGAG